MTKVLRSQREGIGSLVQLRMKVLDDLFVFRAVTGNVGSAALAAPVELVRQLVVVGRQLVVVCYRLLLLFELIDYVRADVEQIDLRFAGADYFYYELRRQKTFFGDHVQNLGY